MWIVLVIVILFNKAADLLDLLPEVIMLFHTGPARLTNLHSLWRQLTRGMLCRNIQNTQHKTHTKVSNTTSRIGSLPIRFASIDLRLSCLTYMCICLAQYFSFFSLSVYVMCFSGVLYVCFHCRCVCSAWHMLQPGMVALYSVVVHFYFALCWFCVYVASVCPWISITFTFEITFFFRLP